MKEINENELKDVTGGSGPAKVVSAGPADFTCPDGYVSKAGKCIQEDVLIGTKTSDGLKTKKFSR